MEKLANRLKSAREQKELSQQELAKLAGVAQSTIGSLEAGSRLSARRITAIANALGVNPLWLAEGKGPRDAKTPPVVELVSEAKRHDQRRLQWVDEQEAELLSLFRACGPAEQRMSLTILRSLPKDDLGGGQRSDQS